METASGHLATVDWVIIIGFLVAVSLVGYVLSKVAAQGMDDYFLGGNKIPWWVLGASTATSNFDMSGTMIIVAVVFSFGYKGFLVEMRGGVGLSLALLMVFLGKWLRRSRVMTSAEWMKLRFGTERSGRAAHLLSGVAMIVLSIGMIAYFAKGAGKFLTYFLPISEFWCTTGMVSVGLFYTLLSGLYGVVFTDVIQMLLLTFTAIYVTAEAFAMRPDVVMPEGLFDFSLAAPTTGLESGLLSTGVIEMFGICVMMWVIRSLLEGMGGVGGYTDQRFFAARTEREASLLTLESIVLSLFRWTLVAGLVIMAYSLIQSGDPAGATIAQDPEQALPIVLDKLLPAGVRGFVLAGLIAAAMSTFDSTLNAGAAYIVRDIYQSYVRPDASNRQLMSASRLATVGLCVVGVGLAAVIDNINQIWGLITMGLGAGLFVPQILRWYWPRFNGYGFAVGTGVGIVAGLVFNGDFALAWPVYKAFPAVLGIALAGCVAGSLLSAPTPRRVLVRFVVQINPWGLWRSYLDQAEAEGIITPAERQERLAERLNDLLAVFFSLPFQISLLVAAMAFVFHDWKRFWMFGSATTLCGVGLYFFWWRNLRSHEDCLADDQRFKDPLG